MPSNLLALAASFGWGTSDFLGGFASRRLPAQFVTAITQVAGAATMFAVVALTHPEPSARDTLLGVAAGIVGPIGLVLLYRGLALGPMNVAAPTTAVAGTATAVVGGIVLRGESFTGTTLAGAICAVIAVVAVSQTPDADTEDHLPGHVRRTLRICLASGFLLGLANVVFSETSPASGVWAIAVGRSVSTLLLLYPAIRIRPETRVLPRHELRLAALAGVGDALATTSLVLAFQRGTVILVGVLGGLFPAVTVLLARIVLRERMGRPQFLGLAFAIATVVLLGIA